MASKKFINRKKASNIHVQEVPETYAIIGRRKLSNGIKTWVADSRREAKISTKTPLVLKRGEEVFKTFTKFKRIEHMK